AQKLGRYIFPVLIHPNTIIPEALRELQYVDFSTGLTASAVASLFNSIYLAEQEKNPPSPIVSPTLSSETVKPPSVNPVSAISAATAAMEKGQFDHAVFLLKRAQAT